MVFLWMLVWVVCSCVSLVALFSDPSRGEPVGWKRFSFLQ